MDVHRTVNLVIYVSCVFLFLSIPGSRANGGDQIEEWVKSEANVNKHKIFLSIVYFICVLLHTPALSFFFSSLSLFCVWLHFSLTISVNELEQLHKRRLQPGLEQDEAAQEQEIELATRDITRVFHTCQHHIGLIAKKVAGDSLSYRAEWRKSLG